jgi:DNA-binding protein H-NS
LLNAAGANGCSITKNSIAYLKRPLEELAPAATTYGSDAVSLAEDANVKGDDAKGGRTPEATVKYRDPRTNETWSGRGRMANWLKRKQEAGEDIEKYLV